MSSYLRNLRNAENNSSSVDGVRATISLFCIFKEKLSKRQPGLIYLFTTNLNTRAPEVLLDDHFVHNMLTFATKAVSLSTQLLSSDAVIWFFDCLNNLYPCGVLKRAADFMI